MRWIIVSSITGQPTGPKTSFKTKALAKAHCGPDEEPCEAHCVSEGPFSDRVESYNLGYMQGRGAA